VFGCVHEVEINVAAVGVASPALRPIVGCYRARFEQPVMIAEAADAALQILRRDVPAADDHDLVVEVRTAGGDSVLIPGGLHLGRVAGEIIKPATAGIE
jgi:hypothetical protein